MPLTLRFRPALALLAAVVTIGAGSSSCRGPRAFRAEAPPVDRAAARTEWIRALVELRGQVDLARIAARQRRAGMTRSERRTATLAALKANADRGRRGIEPLLARLERERLLSDWVGLRIRSVLVVTARPAALELLRDDPRVAAVVEEYDSVREARRRAGASAPDDPPPVPPGDSWAVEALGLSQLWGEGVDGRGIVVGILDSGVDARHAALAGGEAAGRAWFDPLGGYEEPVDTAAHGTQVLVSAVGRAVGGRALGAAPGASWAAALANRENSYNNVHMALAADWMLFDVRPDVLLGAWGHGRGSCDDRDRWLLEAFRAAGTVPVFAAGNDGPAPSSGQAPATLAGLFPDGRGPLSVGAVDRNLRVIEQSGRGPRPCGGPPRFPEIVAPGWMLPVPSPLSPAQVTLGSGTSLAVGWAGGVLALVLQVAPEMSVEHAELLLRETARDLPPPGVDDRSGHGLIDARAAVEAAGVWRRERSRRR